MQVTARFERPEVGSPHQVMFTRDLMGKKRRSGKAGIKKAGPRTLLYSRELNCCQFYGADKRGID